MIEEERMPSIRPSTKCDGPRVMEIWRKAVDATHDFLKVEDRIALDRELSDFLPSAPLWLAVDEADEPMGFMMLNDAHMEALFIDPRFIGLGIGRTLVDHAILLCPDLTTDVNEQNGKALGFYRHMGFQPTGRSDLDGQGRPYPLIHLRRMT